MQVLDRLHPGYGIAVLRIFVGIVLLVAGYQKLNMGVAGLAGFFASVGIPAAGIMAPLIIGFEIVGGLLLIVGAFVRFIGVAMIVQFLVAGLLVSLPSRMGWDLARLDFLLTACGALFLLSGAGKLSVDAWLAVRRGAGDNARSTSFA